MYSYSAALQVATHYGDVPPTPKEVLGSIYHSDWAANDSGISLSGGKVVSLPNRGLNSTAMAQSTGSKQPTWSATSFSGKPGITFSSASTTDLRANVITGIAAGSRMCVWAVFQETGAHNKYFFYVSDSAQVHTVMALRGDGTHWLAGLVCADGTDQIQSNPDNNRHVYQAGALSTTAGRLVIDGVATSGVYSGALTYPAQEMTMGSARSTGNDDAVFARVIVANGDPSASQLAAMMWYLRHQDFGVA